jgi:hypothetical protein
MGFWMNFGGVDLNSVLPASGSLRPDRAILTRKTPDSAASAYILEGTLSGKVFQKPSMSSQV